MKKFLSKAAPVLAVRVAEGLRGMMAAGADIFS
jgi:hypothetical protein